MVPLGCDALPLLINGFVEAADAASGNRRRLFRCSGARRAVVPIEFASSIRSSRRASFRAAAMAKLNRSNNPNKASTAERTVLLSLSVSDFFRPLAKPIRHASSERPTRKLPVQQKRSTGLLRPDQIFDRALW